MLIKNYYVWIEIEANKQRVLNKNKMEKAFDKCVESNIGSIILSVKDTSGFGIYNSEIVPHYHEYDNNFEPRDYLKKYIEMAHSKGLKLYAAVDVFSEGTMKFRNEKSPGFVNPQWQTHMYGIDGNGSPKINPISHAKDIRTTGAIDDFDTIFVNPIRDDVREYELSIIKELVENYNFDGIVLDRVRYVGLASDFSNYTRDKFEEFINKKVENWPTDIYKLKDINGELKVEYGDLFGKWSTFRAHYIKKFICSVEEFMSLHKEMEFIDYTGSWYPIYYMVGANWASKNYVPEEYPFNVEGYSETGYAEHIDKLLSGFYYPEVTMEEAKENNRPDYWYSVEGSGIIAEKVVKGATPIIGSLFVQQYENNPEAFKKAIDMCFKKSEGCMIFDMCYLEDYHWYSLCKRE